MFQSFADPISFIFVLADITMTSIYVKPNLFIHQSVELNMVVSPFSTLFCGATQPLASRLADVEPWLQDVA